MKPKNFLKVLIFCASFSFVFTACQKEISQKKETANSVDEASLKGISSFSSEEMNHIGLILSSDLAKDVTTLDAASAGCSAVITYSPAPDVYPRTATIDWGTGCTNGGVTRSGKMHIYYTGNLSVLGSKSVTTYDNYYINGIKFEGKLRFANNGELEGDKIVYRLTYKDKKTIQENGDYININGHARVIKKTGGAGFPGFPDGNFRETTGAEGYPLTYTYSTGGVITQYILNITSPLIYNEGCAWITKGVSQYTYGDGSIGVLDYGTGGCDDQATYTRYGVTTPITLTPH